MAMMRHTPIILLASAAVICAVQASAQSTVTPAPVAAPIVDPAQDTASQSADPVALGDIVVTATRRTQNIL